ncbi:MAG: hypothetical protein K8T25_22335 [Planctomycetia bacterium]|nr:hypothetical protein [Planctomycetia bacterium]
MRRGLLMLLLFLGLLGGFVAILVFVLPLFRPVPQIELAGRTSQRDAINKLIAAIDKDPDWLHSDYTPAVHELTKIGWPAIEPLLDVLLTTNEETRMRAQRALEGITMEQYGFRRGRGWNDPRGEDRFRQFWKSLGDYNYNAGENDRRASIAKWRAWLAAGRLGP